MRHLAGTRRITPSPARLPQAAQRAGSGCTLNRQGADADRPASGSGPETRNGVRTGQPQLDGEVVDHDRQNLAVFERAAEPPGSSPLTPTCAYGSPTGSAPPMSPLLSRYGRTALTWITCMYNRLLTEV
jgi:hypothetical protein